MNGRLYDPLLRRFLNADAYIQDPYNSQNYNMYAYVLNNPLMFFDPSGMLTQKFIDEIMASPNGTTWTNTGDGFTNNWGGKMDYDGNPMNYGGYSNMGSGGGGSGGGFGGGYSGPGSNSSGGILLPEVILTGKKSDWGSQIQNHYNNFINDWNKQNGFNTSYSGFQKSQSGWGNTSPWGVAWATSGALVADDVTVIGAVDDVAIVGVLGGALVYDANYRTYITYILTGPNGQKYAGRASGFGDPTSIMMNRFSTHHMKLAGYGHPVLDKYAQGYPTGYSAI